MAHFFEQKNRNVIPNFRSFAKTIEVGELNHARIASARNIEHGLSQELLSWEKDKSIGTAADLLSSSVVAGITKVEQVQRAADFVLRYKQLASPSQADLAEYVLERSQALGSDHQISKISDFLETHTQSHLHKKINRLKQAAIRFQGDPIVYIELARLYSILGQRAKAERCMLIALGVAPDNRYVLRSFVRLYAHYGQIEFAYDLLSKSSVSQHDPWLFSAQIALATILERHGKLVKPGKEILHSGRFSDFSLAELGSAMGTIELLDGSRRKSRDLFRSALRDPNDNTLAQVEWVLSRDKLVDVDLTRFNVKRNFEALALEAFNNSDWETTLRNSENWFIDMPFAKSPVMLGSHVCSVILDDYKMAEAFCRAGLLAHPGDPQLLNNLAYSLALDGRVDEALSLANSLSLSDVEDSRARVCLTATKGLVYFRKGNQDVGRDLYLQAINSASAIDDPNFTQLAILNYAREEILCGSEYAEAVMHRVQRMKIDPRATSLKVFLDKTISLFEKKVLKGL